jgi:hypothetical protein
MQFWQQIVYFISLFVVLLLAGFCSLTLTPNAGIGSYSE